MDCIMKGIVFITIGKGHSLINLANSTGEVAATRDTARRYRYLFNSEFGPIQETVIVRRNGVSLGLRPYNRRGYTG